jgi:hypothetical protein
MPEGVPMSEKDLGIVREEDEGREETEVTAVKKPEEAPEVIETPVDLPTQEDIGSRGNLGESAGEGGKVAAGPGGAAGKSPDSSGEGLGKTALNVVGEIGNEGGKSVTDAVSR